MLSQRTPAASSTLMPLARVWSAPIAALAHNTVCHLATVIRRRFSRLAPALQFSCAEHIGPRSHRQGCCTAHHPSKVRARPDWSLCSTPYLIQTQCQSAKAEGTSSRLNVPPVPLITRVTGKNTPFQNLFPTRGYGVKVITSIVSADSQIYATHCSRHSHTTAPVFL